MDSDFDKLVDNLTKQQQRRTHLDIVTKKADARKKALDAELTAMQCKEELLVRQLPELRKEIARQSALRASQQADLIQLQNGCATMQSSLDSVKEKVQRLRENVIRKGGENDVIYKETEEQLRTNIQILERIVK